MDLLQEYKELYYKELEHSDRLNNKIATSITLLTILGTGILYFAKNMYSNFNIRDLCCCISLAVFIILIAFFLICIFNFIKAYFGHKYLYFPVAGAKQYINQTFEESKKEPNDQAGIAESRIKTMMMNKYINCAINNRNANNNKNKYHWSLCVWTIRTFLVLLIFAMACFSTNL